MLSYTPGLQLIESYAATYYIYVLKNPVNNEIFYVGKTTKELKMRLSGHLSDSGGETEKGKYILSILESGGKPIIESVEVIYGICYLDKIKANQREYYWIKYYKNTGAPLTNKVGTDENSCNLEYQGYLNSLKNGKSSWHYYYCGKTKYGIKVYDEEKMNEDGFKFPDEKSDMMPSYTEINEEFKEKVIHDNCYDDENPDYIKSSLEEI